MICADVFHTQPQNKSARVNDSVTFECTYESQYLPMWIINKHVYDFLTSLPSHHYLDRTGSYLTVFIADTAMNGSTYQCIVDTCVSETGYLNIIAGTCISVLGMTNVH